MSKLTIKAPAKSSFDISIENSFANILSDIDALNFNSKKIFVLTEEKIWSLYEATFKEQFSNTDYVINPIIIDVNTINSLSEAEFVYNLLNSLNACSEDMLFSFGGSSIVSLAGFIASNFEGGIPLIHIPTTLFAMTESSVNGKTYLNYNNKSNGLCNIYYPKFVYINTDLLNSLEEIHYYSGFAHIMRTAIIKSASVYEWLIDNMYEITDKEPSIIADMIEQTISIERIYIEKDILCKSDRLVLNLGDAIAKAIETATNHNITYGECLALGIIGAAHISYKRDMLSLDEYLEIRDMFVPFNLPITIENIDVEEIISNIPKQNDMYSFILLKKIGKAVIDNSVTYEEIKAALAEIHFTEDDMME